MAATKRSQAQKGPRQKTAPWRRRPSSGTSRHRRVILAQVLRVSGFALAREIQAFFARMNSQLGDSHATARQLA
jgi:hypothetical protein